MKIIQKVALVGPGALGISYALPLREHLPQGDFCLLADAGRKARYEKDGFIVNGKREDFQIRSPEEAGICDLVIIATKFGGLEETVRAIAPCVGQNTILLSLLNGLISEEMLRERYPARNVPNAYVIALSSDRTGNVIHLIKPGIVVFGYTSEIGETEAENLDALEALFTAAKIPYRRSENILLDQWMKFLSNCALNQVSAVLDLNYETFKKDNHARALLRPVTEEVARVAAAEGVSIGPEQIEQSLRLVDVLADESTSSMCQDMRNKAKTEVDMFAGYVMALGKKHGIETPLSEMLYHMIHTLENRF